MAPLAVRRRRSVRFSPDPRRVITKSFVPREEIYADGSTRMEAVLRRIMAMPDSDVTTTLDQTQQLFAGRHRSLRAAFDRSFDLVAPHLSSIDRTERISSLSPHRRQLIGAYFTQEYSIEAAALGNPSIVAAPDQSGTAKNEVRFVMSLRAVGEGHISSIEFRSGVIGAGGTVSLDQCSRWATTGERRPHELGTGFTRAKVADLGVVNEVVELVLSRLGDSFTMAQLESSIAQLDDDDVERSMSGETTRLLHWLTASNYRVGFPTTMELSERVLFPSGPTESHGMEDARFVRFIDDDGRATYYATYTAFDGHQILPQLLETDDFTDFRVTTMSGKAARNKGIALFPRRIGGRFVALGRHDNVNNYVMTSDDVRVWDDATIVQQPEQPWELMQLGNCGSPLETESGWLVITHGVGPVRRYTLGALLLDLDDPTRVIGHLDAPLLSPEDDEREGYVPNVVYSCGSMIHDGNLILPYGYADVGASVATVPLADLLDRLV